ncbi:hypothetical protein CVT24_008717 [Panaeolus cyanescens]|uniref:Protein YTP1-like C-terminal domain-containing protein n=1 Tax=Panaeolus cyanescens TaxID=181874 RepID=A0A409VKH3_9AGAR|nr:hypothetical protein CVT24_008717 [Panaeolus cyanescens]
MYHAPIPPSYYTLDWEDEGHESQHGGFMILHGILMSAAFFVALPISIALRSVKHAAHGISMIAFYLLIILGCAASNLYRKLTPDMYDGAVHGSHSYWIILGAVSLSIVDILSATQRTIKFLRGSNRTLKSFWTSVILRRDERQESPEYSGLMEIDELESSKLSPTTSMELQSISLNDEDHSQHPEQWARSVHRHHRHFSTMSEGTIFDAGSRTHSDDTLHDVKITTRKGLIHQIGQFIFALVERTLVVAAFAQLLIGIVTYTGKQNYINGCLAHLIKGGIFWCYGLLSFGRFLGAFADLGWAWNKAPSGDPLTAEFVESLVIFTYGATNTWMERFGAQPGDPFTTKQIQHISIAVMFCFAGLVGMGIESKRIRKWLASSTFSSAAHPEEMPREAVTEPSSYSGSLNPFPALVIGVTGAAMAAHAQTYLFQVQIHALWGNLLVAFAVLRCFTYFFLWLGPPKSILPSRPPTEAIGSFFLACGGLEFMFSTEEVTIAAMRRGRDDVMMFLNVGVAITCFAFCWTLFVVGFKGWIKSRTHAVVTYRNAA